MATKISTVVTEQTKSYIENLKKKNLESKWLEGIIFYEQWYMNTDINETDLIVNAYIESFIFMINSNIDKYLQANLWLNDYRVTDACYKKIYEFIEISNRIINYYIHEIRNYIQNKNISIYVNESHCNILNILTNHPEWIIMNKAPIGKPELEKCKKLFKLRNILSTHTSIEECRKLPEFKDLITYFETLIPPTIEQKYEKLQKEYNELKQRISTIVNI